LFTCLLRSRAGMYSQAIRLFKNAKIPKDVKIHEFLGMFGAYDCVVIFEAPNEETAAEFVVQFGDAADPLTMMAFPVEALKWTR